MGRLPLGSVSPYVKTSSGGSMDPMKFYCTSYGAAYGKALTNIEKNLFSSVNLTTRIWTLLFYFGLQERPIYNLSVQMKSYKLVTVAHEQRGKDKFEIL